MLTGLKTKKGWLSASEVAGYEVKKR